MKSKLSKILSLIGEGDALLIVDPQICFCPGGELGVDEGNQVMEPINVLQLFFQALGLLIVMSRCWHPKVTKHFAKYGGIWPEHGVQNTKGAEFHPDLLSLDNTIVVSKGMGDEDSYSSFHGIADDGRSLEQILRDYVSGPISLVGQEFVPIIEHTFIGDMADRMVLEGLKEQSIKRLIICGLATDYCVKETVLKALELGFEVILVTEAIRAVNREPGDGDKAIEEMRAAGSIIM